MKCSQCGAQINEGDIFCGSCGNKVAEEVESVEVEEVEFSEEENSSQEEQVFIDPNQCPNCGSYNTKTKNKLWSIIKNILAIVLLSWIPILGWIVIIFAAIGIIYNLIISKRFICKDCGEEYVPTLDKYREKYQEL
ncbi:MULTISPECIES: zinc ribbon domain-containing protein [unclassified Halanaerobium]|uniref:zinc ribbon domain-containing protein n=1 Tax=unclassified Halanaerobium TaxID=2641197 RepID=UPI000DF37E78|nr:MULTISPECIES: zinc ribbon domain-containing protein [unclassified Halanaerobium]RCW43856.1 double zinc ribbon protein [Halanaerobium sp. MA284_MarDTE_T2]RCW80842.1 double zinc ribbon protein [Halanaerobium sp. DL-01]